MGNRRRGRRGGRGRNRGGQQGQQIGLGQAQVQQTPPRDLEAEAQGVLDALNRALTIARATYRVLVRFADDGELRAHRYDDVVERRLPLAHPDALLAVGCTSPHIQQHGPQVRLSRRALDRLSSADVRPADIERGDMLVTALLGVSAAVAARAERGRASRWVGGRIGDAVSIEEVASQPVCASCLADEAAWRALVGRGKRRQEIERALRDGDGVYISRRGGGNGGRPRR